MQMMIKVIQQNLSVVESSEWPSGEVLEKGEEAIGKNKIPSICELVVKLKKILLFKFNFEFFI